MRHSDWLLPGYAIQVKCGPYISSCSCQYHQFEPYFGAANQVAPYLGSISVHQQAESTDPVIETHYDTSTTLLVISSVHTAGNNRKSVPAQNIAHLVHHFTVPVQVAQGGVLSLLHPVTTRSCLSPPSPTFYVTACHTDRYHQIP